MHLLDTNICIYFIKGLYELNRKIEVVGPTNCFISEMTVAELKYGVENSKTPELMRPVVEAFIPKFAVIPVYDALDVYGFALLLAGLTAQPPCMMRWMCMRQRRLDCASRG